jgi:uncharacterized phage protein (TIGR01671 family)
MMRNIKFRGRTITPNDWYYGSLKKIKSNDKYDYYITDERGYNQFVMPETIGEFTNCFDLNDNEVYEGDIIENNKGHKLRIVYENPSFMILNEKCGVFESLTTDKLKNEGWRVIGNIYDNPELLKVEEDESNEDSSLRPIEFRATSFVDWSTWLYGLISIYKDDVYVIHKKSESDTKRIASSIINPDTIQQYTGLKDSKNNKIFEGDILKIKYSSETYYEVYWNKTDASFCIRCDTDDNETHRLSELIAFNPDIEVVDNILDKNGR